MLKKGDLVYIPAEVTLVQFNKLPAENTFDPERTYIGPSPVSYHQLKKPINALLIEDGKRDEQYFKILYEGHAWHVKRKDISGVINHNVN